MDFATGFRCVRALDALSRLGTETLQLLVALLFRPLAVHLRFRALNANVISGMACRRPNLLPVMELLLPLPLLDLQPLARLALLGSARRGLQAAILLLHAKTQRVLLLLAHQLLLLQPPRPWFLVTRRRASAHHHHRRPREHGPNHGPP